VDTDWAVGLREARIAEKSDISGYFVWLVQSHGHSWHKGTQDQERCHSVLFISYSTCSTQH